jgi:S1-C subfamily serine protease
MRYHLVWICLAGLMLGGVMIGMMASPVRADHGADTWRQAAESVVVINPTWPGYQRPGFGAPPGTAPAGSGVFLAVDGASETSFILTSAHVVNRATNIDVINFNGVKTTASLVATDPARDLALLRVVLDGRAIRLARTTPHIGSHSCALGNSFGIGIGISCGVVSAVNRNNIKINQIEDFVQTDAAVNPGSSGGALVDARGHMIGLINAIFTKEADIDAGVNFAISVRLIEDWLDILRKSGKIG